MKKNRKLRRRKREEARNSQHYFKNLLYRILGNKKANGYIYTGVLIIFIALLLSIVLKYYEITGIVNANKDWLSQRMDTYMTQYSIDNYEAFRTGSIYSGSLDHTSLIQGAERSINISGGKTVFHSDRDYMMENVVLSVVSGSQIGLKANYVLVIPLTYAGITFPDIRVNIMVKSRLVDIW